MKSIELIDTHAHLTDSKFADHLDQILSDAHKAGVAKIITVGAGEPDCLAAFELANKYDEIFCVVGAHPHQADDVDSLDFLKPMLDHPKLLALGETGLDYYYDFGDRKKQRSLFEKHVELADQTGLPLVVHCREAFDDTFDVLRSAPKSVRGIFHCFAGNPEQTAAVLELGWYISFAGTVTFKSAENLRESAKCSAIDRIVVETDSPYLSPEPMRKIRPNVPAHVVHTAECLAELFELPIEEFAKITTDNAIRFFGSKLEGGQ